MNSFKITIERKAGTSWPVVVEEEATGASLEIRSEGILELDLLALNAQITPHDYGTMLGQALFREVVRDAFLHACAQSEDCLSVQLFVEAPDLHTLRWERLCAPLDGHWQFLLLDQRTPLTLALSSPVDRHFPPIGREDLRALVLVASPQGLERFQFSPFDVTTTVSSVRRALLTSRMRCRGSSRGPKLAIAVESSRSLDIRSRADLPWKGTVMPFSRFEKLAPEKREHLLDVAAREFAIHGFADASINRILEQAQMSKGATYYYFEDKVDLFCSVVRYASDYLQLPHLEVDLATLTAESFWPTFADLHRLPLLGAFERPWLFTVISVAAQVSPSLMEREPLASLAHQIRTLVMRLIQRGQELGVIRTDLPDELLFAWLHALDHASDHWLMDHWERLDRAAVARVSDQTVAAMSKAVAPEDGRPG